MNQPGPVPHDGTVRSQHRIARLTILAAELASILALIFAFGIETRAFFEVMVVASVGCLVGAVIPRALRPTWFVLLSLVALALVVGVKAGGIVLGVGLVLIATCHLPIAWTWRVALVVVVSFLIAIARAGLGPVNIPPFALTLIGSMFMFRLALYLYAMKHEPESATLGNAMAYFFMLPNACFPLFPVVDFQTFVRARVESDGFATISRGVSWIVHGLVHLLLYRFVLHELALSERWVNDLGDLVQHVVTVFLLYLQVSGQFHVAIGVLHLFGFRLPKTHHFYFLASSFTDFWRRINIYWKDFMVKLFFNPVYLRARRHGETAALIVATCVVFVCTWALHSFQQFWLEGTPRLSWQDAAFWAALAVLVMFSALRERRERSTRSYRHSRGWSAVRARRTLVTFTVLAVLWSFWYAESVPTWIYMWRQAGSASSMDWLLLATVICAGYAIAGMPIGVPKPISSDQEFGSLSRATVRTGLLLGSTAVLCTATVPAVSAGLPPTVARVTRHLQDRGTPGEPKPHGNPPIVVVAEPNPADVDPPRPPAGYYDRLQIRPPEASVDTWWTPDTTDLWLSEELPIVPTDDFLRTNLRPNSRVVIADDTLTINRWGLRGPDVALQKPKSTLRVALIGPSDVMGVGVSDNETFAALVAEELNELARAGGRHVEILNFGVPGLSFAQSVYAMTERSSQFSPDLVLLVAHPRELSEMVTKAEDMVAGNIEVPDSTLFELAMQAGIDPDATEAENLLRLRLVENAWHDRVASWVAEAADRMGVRVGVLLLRTPGAVGATTLKPLRRAIDFAGVPAIDCTDVFDGYRESSLWVSEADAHPNEKAHQLTADCVLEGLEASSLLPNLKSHGGGSGPARHDR